MFTGKILTTMVAITTAVILLSQLNSSSEIIPDIYEPYVNFPLISVLETSCERDCGKKHHHHGKHHHGKHHHGKHHHGKNHHHGNGKKLTGHLPDSVFVATQHLEPTTVMSTGTNFKGNMLGNAGANMQATVNGAINTQTAFDNFESASGVVNGIQRENYEHKQKGCGGCGNSPCNCASGNNGYGQQNTPPADYTPFEMTTPELPTTGMTAYELPAGNGEVMDAQGEIMSVICRSRMMYSTQKRFGYGQSDMIRGDIPVFGCQPVSKTAARAADTLNAGAFGAMFGLNNETAQSTAAIITQDSGGSRATLGGIDLAEAVATSDYGGPILTNKSFLSSSAQLYLDETNGTQTRSAGVNAAWGEVGVETSNPILVTGVTGF